MVGFLEKRKPFRKKILNDAERRLGKMLDDCWHEVCEVARVLHNRKTLTGEHLSEIIQLGEAKKAA
ncbi:hypothetical protein LOS78_06565 [Paracoccus sp. MA]|uniref:hypothetical protein n=1 Tax=Paracoccus sp. MA TaxID=2895796 RepID=UPI001E512050|nr:hypothetical protein [Paracoccus sp. MA]UFM63825.1 hypothetical protein LOS78_06565 [Paracoccus sp. MA]